MHFLAPPTWVKEPEDAEVIEREKIIIECSAHGFPVPEITWRKISKKNFYIL